MSTIATIRELKSSMEKYQSYLEGRRALSQIDKNIFDYMIALAAFMERLEAAQLNGGGKDGE